MSENVKNQFSRFFDPVSNIIVNENLLNSRYVPNTVIARDEQMEKMGHYLSPILRQGEPSNMYIWGDTGVGKTITVKYLLRVLTEGLKSEGKDILIDTVVIDCTAFSFEISACVEILTQLSGISIPFGRQFYQYLNDIWQIIERKASEHSFYTLILFFDEIDAFTEPNNILYQFSRALAHLNREYIGKEPSVFVADEYQEPETCKYYVILSKSKWLEVRKIRGKEAGEPLEIQTNGDIWTGHKNKFVKVFVRK